MDTMVVVLHAVAHGVCLAACMHGMMVHGNDGDGGVACGVMHGVA
jgi:hypothetical protein